MINKVICFVNVSLKLYNNESFSFIMYKNFLFDDVLCILMYKFA